MVGSNFDESLVVLTPQSAFPLLSSPNKKTKVQLAAVTKALEKTLVQDWIETDDLAHQVLHSIANLRERLWHTSLMLLRQTTTAAMKQAESKQGVWKQRGGGYRHTGASMEYQGGLMVQDLQMTLDHDLVQHERMMVSLRSLLATLGQAQEAMSRRLDECYRLLLLGNHHHRPSHEQQLMDNDDEYDDDCVQTTLFTATAKELYRKQKLAARVFDSCNDGLLYTIEDDVVAVANEEFSPRNVAQCCSVQWSRTHPESHLLDCEAILKDMIIKQQNVA